MFLVLASALLKLYHKLAPQDLNYLQTMILKLNRVDSWSCAHPN